MKVADTNHLDMSRCLRQSPWQVRDKPVCVALMEFRSGFSIANQIKFDLRFTDLRLTWCSKLIIDQLCFVFPWIFDFQLRDRRLADPPSTEPTLCQSDWLSVTSIYLTWSANIRPSTWHKSWKSATWFVSQLCRQLVADFVAKSA